MNIEINQDGTTWATQVAEMKQLSQRAAKLSERGAHYFVGWLIGAGMHKPAMMAEFEKVLTRLEKDPELSHCWRDCSNAETPAAAEAAAAVVEAETIAVLEPSVITEVNVANAEIHSVNAEAVEATIEKASAIDEAPPAPVVPEHEHDHSRSGMVKFETITDTEAQESQGFFAKLFRRQRAAA